MNPAATSASLQLTQLGGRTVDCLGEHDVLEIFPTPTPMRIGSATIFGIGPWNIIASIKYWKRLVSGCCSTSPRTALLRSGLNEG
jgi:hypothetical protein